MLGFIFAAAAVVNIFVLDRVSSLEEVAIFRAYNGCFRGLIDSYRPRLGRTEVKKEIRAG